MLRIANYVTLAVSKPQLKIISQLNAVDQYQFYVPMGLCLNKVHSFIHSVIHWVGTWLSARKRQCRGRGESTFGRVDGYVGICVCRHSCRHSASNHVLSVFRSAAVSVRTLVSSVCTALTTGHDIRADDQMTSTYESRNNEIVKSAALSVV